ncbi:hypothetical protein PSECIP111951_01675 [Pseudoalteromonas holothuriae]|uniref:Alpha/beta hydrolase n=1 Tax=Pseudoalteromonas holothuriae TaxID=2963714 RepID=A0A9W4QT94_9GAMM|nr:MULTISPECIES: hypothetical protein [unclassified Pseudoalteromonas]CAH9051927.1 hypothetical protein PSECIP111854_00864 [Pseudoalteromonas sp. CIP111854]CAH9057472.1 hypothetical protein PSECIP111951_01675 [Pseudoalteromonas sp. CIP111951]
MNNKFGKLSIKSLGNTLGVFILCLLTSFTAHSNDYKTILIHGFQPSQLTNPNGTNVISDGQSYWSSYWTDKADERIDWPSYERIEGKIATDWLWPKLKQLSQSGLCESGCVLLTHSTGDLVARYLLDNQANWLENAGLQPLNIVATFDIAGAGGGSELADTAVSALMGGNAWDDLVEAAIYLWLGSSTVDALGVLHDLKVNNARKIAPLPDSRAPRLRFVANSSDFFGITGGFLKGSDDGVVASHSACGASRVGRFGSCSQQIAMDGKIKSQSNAVTGFMPYHYPLIMADDYTHSNIRKADNQGKVTIAQNNIDVAGRNVGFQTYDKSTGFWIFKEHYRYVKNSDSKSVSQLIDSVLP